MNNHPIHGIIIYRRSLLWARLYLNKMKNLIYKGLLLFFAVPLIVIYIIYLRLCLINNVEIE